MKRFNQSDLQYTQSSNKPIISQVGRQNSKSIPGLKSFYFFNGLFLTLTLIQIGLYTSQGISSQCPQLSTIFYGFLAVYAFGGLVPIISFICLWIQRLYTFAMIYTILAVLGKIGVIVATYISTQSHVGYCYVGSDVKMSIAIANVAEACCLCVAILFIRHLRKIKQVKQIQRFMDAGQRKGYF